jgi:hypothetical protein
VGEKDPYATGVSHVRLPAGPLVFGRIPAYTEQRRKTAMAQLRRFDAKGRIFYRPGEVDYGKTHFDKHANGIAGLAIANILETATLCADKKLTKQALAVLDKLTVLYACSVPRGAQTWEVPLHTPDILASAHMTRAYVYAYVLSGKKRYLEQSRYWAWSGVPFVYLDNPTKGPCGAYATIAVLGATNWQAPVWIGQPVQWCGLVYASALYRLSQYDPDGPWAHIARGITLAGLQMTWPTSDSERQGLLPDFFHLVPQISAGPAINPGTVGALLPEAFGRGAIYGFHRFTNGWLAHAPCAIGKPKESGDWMSFSLDGWGPRPYHLVLVGLKKKPKQLLVNGEPVETEHHRELRLLIVPLKGRAEIRARK